MLKVKQKIIVEQLYKQGNAKLILYEKCYEVLKVEAFIGKNGLTSNKVEGDGKTPKGIFKLGLVFGTHDKEDINLNKNIKYLKINKNLYWVDDINSKYYNQLVDATKVCKDWFTAEHLVDYPKQYEYAIEIKTNIKNIPMRRKCDIFTL